MNLGGTGFHVIYVEKYREIDEREFPSIPVDTSMVDFLRKIERGELHKFMIVKGLDDFIKSSTDDAIEQVRNILNRFIKDMLSLGASIVFVVKCEIEHIPDNPTIHGKPLAMIFPRPHDIGSMEPGYLYYPIM